MPVRAVAAAAAEPEAAGAASLAAHRCTAISSPTTRKHVYPVPLLGQRQARVINYMYKRAVLLFKRAVLLLILLSPFRVVAISLRKRPRELRFLKSAT